MELWFCMLQPSPTTFSEVFQCMFDYIDRLFIMVRPRRLLYMAIGMYSTATVDELLLLFHILILVLCEPAEFLWLYACVEVRILYIFVRYCCGRHILLCTCRVPFRSYISFCVSMKVCCFVLICNSLCLLFCNSMSELYDQCISYTCVSFMVAHNFNCGTMALQMVWLLVLR